MSIFREFLEAIARRSVSVLRCTCAFEDKGDEKITKKTTFRVSPI